MTKPTKTTIEDCSLVRLKHLTDSRGSITILEKSGSIPFTVARAYFLKDVPDNKTRGRHAHKILRQIIVAASGHFNVKLHDGTNSKYFRLNRPSIGLYVCPMIWRELTDFSKDCLCLVVASHPYDEDDYYRDFDSFKTAKFK